MRMFSNQKYFLWISMLLISLIAVVGLSEIVLRNFVPLSSIVDHSSLQQKIWYLENFESVLARGQHPTHASHSKLGWTHRPNLREEDFSTNSIGLRGKREYSLKKPSGYMRAVVLGDSFSAGYGVGDEETYAAQLEQLIPDSEFLNLAVSGYGVDQAVLRWELLGHRFEPDLVVLGIFVPDFHRNALTWRFDAPKPRFYIDQDNLTLSSEPLPPMEHVETNVQRLRSELDSFLQLPRVWIASTYFLDRLSRKLRNWREADDTFLEKKQILELLISRLASDCFSRGIELVIVTIATEYTPYPDENRILSLIANAAEKNEVAVLHLDRFLDMNSEERSRSPVFDDETNHWSAAGHRRAATQIAGFLKPLTTVN